MGKMPRASCFGLGGRRLPPGPGRRQTARWALGLALVAVLAWAPADAATFKGTEITDETGTYMVTKDVTVRAGPENKAARAGSLKAGEKVEVFGRTKGNWLAVRKGDKPIGFVHAPMLLPLIDGAVEQDVTGKAAIGRGAHCRFSIHFEGRSEIEGENLQTADYDVAYHCESAGRKFRFNGPMFIAEGPTGTGSKALYQISVDLLDIAEDPDYVFSTVLLYDPEGREVRLDAVSPPEFAAKPASPKKAAQNVREALAGAVEIALSAWSGKVWETLAKSGG